MRRVHWLLPALSALLALVAAGCAKSGTVASPTDADAAFKARATKVAEAWRSNTAGTAWQTGFVPLQDLTVLAADPGFNEETKQAFAAGWFRLAVMLPASIPAAGQVRFTDGSTLSVPLLGADAAYRELDQGDPPCNSGPAVPSPAVPSPAVPSPAVPSRGVPMPDVPSPVGPGGEGSTGHVVTGGCTSLTVTAANLGDVELRTSRGAARVPAWLFDVQGLKAPIARVAVAQSAIVQPPADPTLEPLPDGSGLTSAQDLVSVNGAELTYRLGVGACDYAIQPVFVELPDVVVVAGVKRTRAGVCVDLLKLEPVKVTLGAPLGSRVVLDGIAGRPLTLR